jgi:cholesterol transport system auxiliary component
MTRYSAPLTLSRRSLLAVGGSTLVLAGCGGIVGPSDPPPQIYVIQPQLQALSSMPKVPWQLVVGQPSASESLDTLRIALIRGQALDYYANAQWTDSVPLLFQTLLVQSFENSGKVVAVASATEGVRADYVLGTEIRNFEAHYASDNGAPTIVVDVVARLLTVDQRDVTATLFSRHEAPAARNDLPSVVSAFDQAVGATLGEIAAWTLRQNAAPPTPASAEEPPPTKKHRRHRSN